MPRVPTYDNPQIQEQALQPVRQSGAIDGAFQNVGLASLAKGANDAGQVVGSIIGHEQSKARTAYLKELDVSASDTFRDLLHNPETGFMSKQGRNAIDARAEAIKSVDDYGKKTMEGITDPVAMAEYKRLFSARRDHALNNIDVHTSQQTRQYSIDQTTARAGDQARTMLDEWVGAGDPNSRFANAKATGLDEVKSLGKQQGWSDEVIKKKQLEYLTSSHGAVLDQIMSLDQSDKARSYFSRYENEIDKSQHDVIRKKLEHASLKKDSLDLSMQLQSTVKSFSGQESELTKMYKDGKITAEVFDATKQRIEHDYSKRKMMENEGEKSQMGAAQEWVMKNPGQSILTMPNNLYMWAKNKGHLAGLDSFAQREGRPAERTKELTARGRLLSTAMSDPDEFIKTFKETAFVDQLDLGAQGIKEMQNIAGDMVRGDGKYKATFNTQVLQDAIPKALLESKKKDQRDAFKAIQAEEIDRWKKANPGKTPDDAAYKQVNSAANREWVSVGTMWNSIVPEYKARSEGGNAVPSDFYSSLKKKGATESEIIAAWSLKKGKK